MKTKTAGELRIDHLYHYQSFDNPERLARMFKEGTLYFSAPRDFNDPWDCRPFYDKSALGDAREYERVVQWFVHCDRTHNGSLSDAEHVQREQDLRANGKRVEWMIDQLTSEMDQAIQRQYRVYCLSTQPDSTLMWSHYASSCRGLCLEFSVRNELFCGALQVEYFSKYPRFNIADASSDANLLPLLNKSDVWSYENEFRLIASEHPYAFPDVPETKDGFIKLPKNALRSVIVGAQMPPSERDAVRALVKESGWDVGLKVANLIPDHYGFDINTID